MHSCFGGIFIVQRYTENMNVLIGANQKIYVYAANMFIKYSNLFFTCVKDNIIFCKLCTHTELKFSNCFALLNNDSMLTDYKRKSKHHFLTWLFIYLIFKRSNICLK